MNSETCHAVWPRRHGRAGMLSFRSQWLLLSEVSNCAVDFAQIYGEIKLLYVCLRHGLTLQEEVTTIHLR